MSSVGRAPYFDTVFRERLSELLSWRRDVRRFRTKPLPDGALERLIGLACLAPSVGLSQPWRFVVVDDPGRRHAVRENFRVCNAEALAAYHDERAQRYAALKLEGLDEAPAQVAVFVDRGTEQGYGVGRRTMPETADYSAVAAIQTLWLAARAESIGVGWVSILDPTTINDVLDVPKGWSFIAYLCVGYPQDDSSVPELERAGWEYRRAPAEFILRR